MDEQLHTYRIPVSWSAQGFLSVEATCLDEAIILAEVADFPKEHDYIEGSWEVNRSLAESLNDEKGLKESYADVFR
jgi:hypothetical protein